MTDLNEDFIRLEYDNKPSYDVPDYDEPNSSEPDYNESSNGEQDYNEQKNSEPDYNDRGNAGQGNSSHNTDKLMKQIAKAEKGFKNYHWFLIYLVIFLVVIWILFFKIIGITHMPNVDMSPRVDAGDLLIFYRLDRDASFQELVIFEKVIPGETEKRLLVGRVIAAPGDTIEINDSNRPIVNGNVLIEDKIYYDTPKRDEMVNYPLTLGEDEYFILVDSRKDGLDSRYFGPVKKKEILGTIINVIRRNKL